MSLTAALLGFALVAALITITPGLDTALVLRFAARYGRRTAFAAALGINAGILVWGVAAALGVSALLVASEVAYTALRWAGAAYMVWLGVRMLIAAVRGTSVAHEDSGPHEEAVTPWTAFRTGLSVNLMNPKIGAFYVALLPQFMSPDVPAGLMGVLLALVHNAEGLAWFGLLILLVGLISPWLRRPAVQRGLDGVVGAFLVGFGAKLALQRP